MNRRILTLLSLAAAAAFALALPLRALPPGTENYNKSTDTVKTCDDGDEETTDGGTLTIHAPTKLWPPNHKYNSDVWVTADDANDGTVELESHGYHDQYDDDGAELNGSGGGNGTNAGDDITSDDETASVTDGENEAGDPEVVAVESGEDVVTTDWQVRAERSGHDKTGRQYTLSATATFSDGTTCSNSVTMTVPHDMRPSNR